MWCLYRFYQLNESRCRCKWDVIIEYLTRAIFEKQWTPLHVIRIIIFLSSMCLFCWQKCAPRPKRFPRLEIFSTSVDHIILIHRRKSFIPDNRIKWTWPNIDDSTRSLSPGIENIFIRPVFLKLRSKQPNNFPQQPRTQNPPYNTLATIQTSNIERPDPRVTHRDVYHPDGRQPNHQRETWLSHLS